MAKDTPLSSVLDYLVAAASIVLIVAGLKLAAPIVNVILLAFLLAFSISPIQHWLIKKRCPRGLAVSTTILLILTGGSALISILAVSVAGLIGKLPAYEASLTDLWTAIKSFFISRGIDISGLLSLKEFDPKQMVAFAGNIFRAILQGLSNSFFIVIVMVFALVELSSLQSSGLRGKSAGTRLENRVEQAVEDVGKYISITSWSGFLNAVANFLLLLVLGVDFALTWAVISFFFNFIPNIGIVMAVIPPAIIALLESGWVRALLVILGYAILNFIAENVVKPRTMKARLHISPLLTILSVIIWSWVLGAPGTVLAVPLTITIQKLVREQISRRRSA